MNPEDRLSQMLNRARGEDRVTESNWNEFASSARRSVRIQRFAAAGLARCSARLLAAWGPQLFWATLSRTPTCSRSGPTESRAAIHSAAYAHCRPTARCGATSRSLTRELRDMDG